MIPQTKFWSAFFDIFALVCLLRAIIGGIQNNFEESFRLLLYITFCLSSLSFLFIYWTLWKNRTNLFIYYCIRLELLSRLALLSTIVSLHIIRVLQTSTLKDLVTTQTHVVVLEALAFTVLSLVTYITRNSPDTITRQQVAFLLALSSTFVVLFVGAITLNFTENFGFENAWNFVNVTSLTIGYGNILVTTVAGKIFLITYGNLMLIAVGTLLITLRNTMKITKKESYKVGVFLLIFWFTGATVFMLLESWTFLNSVYFIWVTFSTVGYGDLYPTNPWAWEFWLLYVYVGVGIVSYIIGLVSDWGSE